MMDKTARDVLTVILDRLRQHEKDRLEDRAIWDALVRSFQSVNPSTRKLYDRQLILAKERLAKDPAASLDEIYDGLKRILKDLDPPETAEQEMFRLLESCKGPKQ